MAEARIIFVRFSFFTLFSLLLGSKGDSSKFIEEFNASAKPVFVTENVNSCKGEIFIAVSDGTEPYSFVWTDEGGNKLESRDIDSGQTELEELVPGKYTLVVTDAVGEFNSETYTISDPENLDISIDIINVSCKGESSGRIRVTIKNGKEDFDWELLDSSDSEIRSGISPSRTFEISNLLAGTYKLYSEDFFGCTGEQTFTINEPAEALGVQMTSSQNPSCLGESSGSITAQGTGGWGGYSYEWFSGNTSIGNSQTITDLAAGNYRVVVTDTNDCKESETFTLTNPPAIGIGTSFFKHVTCDNGSDGAITAEASGGNGNFSYSWDNGANTAAITGLVAGEYKVTVTDQLGCSAERTFVISEPSPISIAETITHVRCKGESSGAIDVMVSGGSGSYFFSWSNGATTTNISGLTAGNYELTVTDGAGCSHMEIFTVTEPSDGLSISGFSQIQPTCAGATDGSLEVNFSGGTGPYEFIWSNGMNTQEITGIAAGSYSVTIVDANDCSVTESHELSDPPAIALAVSTTDPKCFESSDGHISVVASQGTAPYSYEWSDGPLTSVRNNLTAGTYEVTVTDAKGCSISQEVVLTEPLRITSNALVNNISCNGIMDGSIILAVTGGTAPYDYSWSNGESTSSITGLSVGNYQVTITDANGCNLVEDYDITQPAPLSASLSKVDILCREDSSGSIDLTVSGGTAPYFYNWSNGAVTEDLTALPAGNYSVLITDANGCTLNVSREITQPDTKLTITGDVTQLTCSGGTNGAIDLTVTGGVGVYDVEWSHGSKTQDQTGLGAGIYTVTISDDIGCIKMETFEITPLPPLEIISNVLDISCHGQVDGSISLQAVGGEGPYSFKWQHGPTSENLTGLPEGSYSVTVTDNRGCQVSEVFEIIEPGPLGLQLSSTDVSCYEGDDGSLTAIVSGGTTPYTFDWSNGSTAQNQQGVMSGTYTLIVTDARGCSQTKSIVVDQPANPLSATADITHLTCSTDNSGSINLSVSGGTAPYSFLWNTGHTGEDLNGLVRGFYFVEITDVNGCILREQFEITAPPAISLDAFATELSCQGAGDGTIDLFVQGGTAPYSYSWSNGASTEDISGLDSGTYEVTVTDANGCSESASFEVDEPVGIIVQPFVEGVSCFGEEDGVIDIDVAGGERPYTYLWSDGSTSQDLRDLAGGDYTVTVTDFTGCNTTVTITVPGPESALSATGVVSPVACSGTATGRIDLEVTGGTAPFSYIWSNGTTLSSLIDAPSGNYEVTITDRNGCDFTTDFVIPEVTPLTHLFTVSEPNCPGDDSGSIILEVSGGVAPYSYLWSNGSTSKDQHDLTTGAYTVTITDANQCSLTQSVLLIGSRGLDVIVDKVDVTCRGGTDGRAALNVSGGSGVYTYLWSNGSVDSSQEGLSAGLYQVEVSDEDGCGASVTVNISEPSLPLSVAVDYTEALRCADGADGTALANPTGGTAPYTYRWSNGESTRNIIGLTAGEYTVVITDLNGCTAQQSFTITQPDSAIEIDISGKLRLDCPGEADGNIQVSVQGGTGPYALLWENGSTADERQNLRAGNYILLVTDSRGCIKEEVISVEEPGPLVVAEAIINDTQCFGAKDGTIEVNIEGGTAPYEYQWSNGSTSRDLVGVGAGQYSLMVEDAMGCTMEALFELGSAPELTVNPSVTEISCHEADDASIALNIGGGTGPFDITWNTGQTSQVITNLAPGEYRANVTDSNDCTIERTFIISAPLPITVDAQIKQADDCDNPLSGGIITKVSGGRAPYRYVWSTGATTPHIEDLAAGEYTLTVTDDSGCEQIASFDVTEPAPISIELTPEIVADCQQKSMFYTVQARVEGGFGNYSYQWSRGDSDGAMVEVHDAGRLVLQITDGRGCTKEQEIDLDFPQFGQAEFDFQSESLERDGVLTIDEEIQFTDLSTGEIVAWFWDFGDGQSSDLQNPLHAYSARGIYDVVLSVTDATGCVSVVTKRLNIEQGYAVMAPTAFTPNDDALNDMFKVDYYGFESIRLSVFDNWGKAIFSTTDLENKGWDGIVKGQKAPVGKYVFRFWGRTHNGVEIVRSGEFGLIR